MKKMTTFYSPGSGDRLKIIESTAECEAIPPQDQEEIK